MDDDIRPPQPLTKDKEATLNHLANVIQAAYLNPRVHYWRSFFSGVFSGLGATIGVAIVIALLSLLIRKLGGLPVIGNSLLELSGVLPKR